MSGLAAVVSGKKRAGIYRWHGHFDVPTVQHTVEHAGWRFAHLDGWVEETSAEFLSGVGAALGLPEQYAATFDSLADCLHDVDAAGAEGIILLWDGWGPLARADHRAFSVALSVLGSRVNADRGAPFAVLLRGDGPDPALPSLD